MAFRRVTRSKPCPICNRPDWCRVSADGAIAICNRTESSKPAKGHGGGWIHRLTDDPPPFAGASRPADDPPTPAAPRLATIEHRNKIYRCLQARTYLSAAHRDALLARGFTESEIERRGYRTLPLEGRSKLALGVICNAGRVGGVPGFYLAPGRRGSYWTFAGSPGLFIPCRDAQGRIQSWRIRPDEQRGGGKYRWFSSAERKSGTASGAVCHVAKPLTLTDSRIWIVEGELKADLAADRLGATVVSIPGVTLWRRALDLGDLFPAGSKIVVAMDADWRDKTPVHEAAWSLMQAGQALGLNVEVATWDSDWKGLDDLVTTGQLPKLANTMPPPTWPIKISSRILTERVGLAATATEILTMPAARAALAQTVARLFM